MFNFATTQWVAGKNGFSRVKAGTGRATIVVCGDSTSWGEGGGDSGGNMRQNAKERCWPTVLAKQLTALGIPANYENINGSGGNSGVTFATDFQNFYKTGFNLTGGWVGLSSSTTAGGCLFTNTTDTTGVMTYTPQIPVDRFEIADLQVSTGGIIAYSIDGGTEVQLNQANATSSFRRTVINCGSVGTHTLSIRRISGNAFVAGVRSWNSTVPAVDIINLGRCSSQTSDWMVNSNPWSPLPSFANYCLTADIVIIDHTINDELNNQTVANYKANLLTLINTAKAGGAMVILMTGNPSNVATITDAVQQTFRQAMKDVAIANNVPMIDQWDKYGTWVALNALGWMYNNNHPNKLGYADLGSFMANMLYSWAS
jgi:lysophospholipase L1-like esterase